MASNLSKYKDIIASAAQEYGLSPQLLTAQIMQESGGNPNATSPVGAHGLMQLMPDTAKEMGVTDTSDPTQNIHGGAKYLAQQINDFGGDVGLGLAAYNAGPGAVRKHGGIPPYKETQNYVSSIMNNMQLDNPTAVNDKPMSFLDKYAPVDATVPESGGVDKPTSFLDKYAPIDDKATTTAPAPTTQQSQQPMAADMGVPPSQGSPQQDQSWLEKFGWVPDAITKGLGVQHLAGTGVGEMLGDASAQLEVAKNSAWRSMLGEDNFNKLFGNQARTTGQYKNRVAQAHNEMAKSSENNPIKSTILEALSFGAGPGKLIPGVDVAEGSGLAAKLGTALVNGGLQGAGYEATVNPDATPESIAKTGAIGAGTGVALTGVSKIVGSLAGTGAKQIIGKLVGSKDPKFIQAVMDEPGLLGMKTREDLVSSAQNIIETKVSKLDNIFTKKYADRTVDLSHLDSEKIGDFAKMLKDNSFYKTVPEADKLLQIAQDMKNGPVKVADANKLKQTMWELSKFTKSGDPSVSSKAQSAYELGQELKTLIEKAVPEEQVSALNKSIGTSIQVRNKIGNKIDSGSNWTSIMKGGGLSLVDPALGKLSLVLDLMNKTVPGATMSSRTLEQIAKISNDNPKLSKFITRLVPQAFTDSKKP